MSADLAGAMDRIQKCWRVVRSFLLPYKSRSLEGVLYDEAQHDRPSVARLPGAWSGGAKDWGAQVTRREAVRLLTEKGCNLVYVTWTEASRSDRPGVEKSWHIGAWIHGRLARGDAATLAEATSDALTRIEKWYAAPEGDEDRIARGNYG